MRLTLRHRLVLAIGAACIVVFGAVGFASVRAVRAELVERMDQSLVRSVASAPAAAGFITPEQSKLLREASGPSEITVLVATPDSTKLAVPAGNPDTPLPGPDLDGLSYDELLARQGAAFGVPGEGDGSAQRVAVQQLGSGSVVIYARSLADVDATTRQLTLTVLGICAIGLIVLLVLVALAGRRVVRPLEHIIDVAGVIGAGELDRRLPSHLPDQDTERLAEALNAMLSRLEHAFAAQASSERQLREFLSDASHELRTPLTTVRAHADLLSTPTLPSDKRDESILKIQAETARMTRLVEDLLILALLDQGTELELVATDLVPIARGALDDLSIVDDTRPIIADLPDRPVWVRGDPDRLRQIVDNLLANVRVHTPSDVEARVTVRSEGGEAILLVADEGPGIADEDQARVFDRFRRGRPSPDSRPGAGLGLPIAAALAVSHQGSLSLVPTPRGATFALRLPLAATPANHTADARLLEPRSAV
ncbi:MAG TPA: HAMP domain-containing sensor histidine kinase [Acidimicrobiales bacterium]